MGLANSLLAVIGDKLAASPHLQFYLMWVQALLTVHGPELRKQSNKCVASPSPAASGVAERLISRFFFCCSGS